VKKFERRAGYFLLEVILRISRTYKPLMISGAQLDQINVVDTNTKEYTYRSAGTSKISMAARNEEQVRHTFHAREPQFVGVQLGSEHMGDSQLLCCFYRLS
jgi:hypothetical protein